MRLSCRPAQALLEHAIDLEPRLLTCGTRQRPSLARQLLGDLHAAVTEEEAVPAILGKRLVPVRGEERTLELGCTRDVEALAHRQEMQVGTEVRDVERGVAAASL